jgi:invasion protein IalB
MNKTAIIALLILLHCKATAATLLPVQPGPVASKANEAFDASNLKMSSSPAWVSNCVSDARKSPLLCSMQGTLVLKNSGQAVAFVIVRMQPDVHEPLMVVRVPGGVYLPAGLSISVGDGKPQSMPLQTCDQQGCFAEMQINSDLLAALKVGKQLSIICQDAAKNKIVFPITLDNFADVFQKIQ